MGLKPETELKHLEGIRTATDKYSLDTNIKPCIVLLLNTPITSIQNGGSLGRSTAGIMIATELRNNSQTETQIQKRLEIWNRGNLPPLKQSELRGILKQCFKTKLNDTGYRYNYNCDGKYTELLQFEEACLGKEYCYYYQKNYTRKGHRTKINYITTSWQYVLTPREQIILFYVLPELEKLKKYYPGTPIYTTFRELHKHTGINQSYFKDILEALKQYGLIEYTPGTQRIWEHKATEIKRILPPPKIPKEYINKPKEYKHKTKGIK